MTTAKVAAVRKEGCLRNRDSRHCAPGGRPNPPAGRTSAGLGGFDIITGWDMGRGRMEQTGGHGVAGVGEDHAAGGRRW